MPFTYDVQIDFYRDWIQRLQTQLEVMEAKLGGKGYKRKIDKRPEKLCIQYFNLRRRMVDQIPRNVMFSKEFTCPPSMQAGLDLVREKIEKGQDLTPHLSSLLLDLDYNDPLLNDWGIHHLHLGTVMDEATGFIKRTGPLLFARFDHHTAYFINVMKHGDWAKQEVVRIIHENWPDSISGFRLKGVEAASPELSDRDIAMMRRSGSNVLIEVAKGAVYGPIGMGYATSGTSIDVVRTCDYFSIRLRSYQNWLKDNISKLVEEVKENGVTLGTKFNFLLGIEDLDVYAFEVYSRTFIKLGPLYQGERS